MMCSNMKEAHISLVTLEVIHISVRRAAGSRPKTKGVKLCVGDIWCDLDSHYFTYVYFSLNDVALDLTHNQSRNVLA